MHFWLYTKGMQCILINYTTTTNNNIKTKNHNALLHLFFGSHERSSYYVSCHSMVTCFLDDLEVMLREVQISDGGQSMNEQVSSPRQQIMFLE